MSFTHFCRVGFFLLVLIISLLVSVAGIYLIITGRALIRDDHVILGKDQVSNGFLIAYLGFSIFGLFTLAHFKWWKNQKEQDSGPRQSKGQSRNRATAPFLIYKALFIYLLSLLRQRQFENRIFLQDYFVSVFHKVTSGITCEKGIKYINF